MFALAIDPSNSSTLYVGTTISVFRSLDAGASWTPFDSGLDVNDVLGLAIDPARPTWVYAATDAGLQRIEGACASDTECGDGNPCTADTCNVDGSCANVAVANGIACDDDDACTVATTCQAGSCEASGPLPVCDDGIACTDEVCAPTTGICVTTPRVTGSLCDDGISCSIEDQCGAGVCAGSPRPCVACLGCDESLGCVPKPRLGCLGPSARGGSLSLRVGTASGDQLKWTWKSAGPTAKSDFGNPLTGTTYAVCLYDRSPGETRLLNVPGTELQCATVGCWKETPRGYKLKGGTLRSLSLGASGSDKGTISLVGKWLNLAPSGPPALPLTMDPAVIVQLQRNDDAACWGAEYATSSRNTPVKFQAKVP